MAYDDMIIGAVTFELEVERGGSVPGFAGRLLHAAFFYLVQEYSPELADSLHNEENVKPFAVSPLKENTAPYKMIYEKTPRRVEAGTHFLWRVSAWRTDIVEFLLNIPMCMALRIGQLDCRIVHAYVDGRHDSGLMRISDLMAASFTRPFTREISFHFHSPVSFRRDRYDYPAADGRLIFASLADKWQQAALPADIDRASISELAEQIYPTDWQGRTQRVYFGKNYGLCGFVGDYSYSLRAIDTDSASVLTLLAQFANIAGTGRMTGQGFGQTRVKGQ